MPGQDLLGQQLWPLGLYILAVAAVVAAMLLVSWLVGERHKEAATDETYESGIAAQGDARVHLSIKFYLVAMFFVLFDLEAAFIFGWAVSARELGWAGYAEICVFVGVLVATWAYIWRAGGLDWRRQPAEEQ